MPAQINILSNVFMCRIFLQAGRLRTIEFFYQCSFMQTGVVCDQTAGGGGGKQIVLCQHAFIGSAKLHHQFFFLVVSQKCNIHITLLSNYSFTGTVIP